MTDRNKSTDQRCDLDWLKQAAQSRAFGPTTETLLMPYVLEIERLRRLLSANDTPNAYRCTDCGSWHVRLEERQ